MRLKASLRIKKKTKLAIISKLAALTFLLVFISACGAPSESAAPAAPAAAPAAPAGAPQPAAAWDAEVLHVEDFSAEPAVYSDSADFLNRMVIRNASLSMETTKFDDTIYIIEEIVAAHGGFVENSFRQTSSRPIPGGQRETFWRAGYTLRVPVDYFDTVNRELMALGNVVSFSAYSEDVTMQFHDMQSRLNIREEEERRILNMLETVTDLSERIQLEARLSNLHLAMEGYRRRMTEIDHLASFSTIELTLTEVFEEDEALAAYVSTDTFGGRMFAAFGSSLNFSLLLLEGVALLAAALVLPVAILAIPVFGGIIFVKKVLRKS